MIKEVHFSGAAAWKDTRAMPGADLSIGECDNPEPVSSPARSAKVIIGDWMSSTILAAT